MTIAISILASVALEMAGVEWCHKMIQTAPESKAPVPKTVRWQIKGDIESNWQSEKLYSPPTKFEFGLADDGSIVWREIK